MIASRYVPGPVMVVVSLFAVTGGGPRPGNVFAAGQARAAAWSGKPITLEVDFAQTINADMAELCPGAERAAGRTVRFAHREYPEVFRAWRAILNLSGAG